MAQTLQVLKCFSCSVFQVQIKKKTKRWECKMCGEKQSVIKVYGEGSGKDCRLHVQKLNELRGKQEEAKKKAMLEIEEDSEEPSWDDAYDDDDNCEDAIPVKAKKSKWSDFLDDDSQDESPGIEANRDGIFPVRKAPKQIMMEGVNNNDCQIKGKEKTSLNIASHSSSVGQPFFTADHVNRQPKLHLESECKHPTYGRFMANLNQEDPAKETDKKTALVPTPDLSDEDSGNSKHLKYKGLFCATKNEELDELLNL